VTEAHEEVIHLEKAASELVGPLRHDIWDVHCPESREVVLTFHIGLALRLEYAREREVPVAPGPAELLPGSWRRWRQAFEAYDNGDEAETVQVDHCLVGKLPRGRGTLTPTDRRGLPGPPRSSTSR
jgi:hypothetical protein